MKTGQDFANCALMAKWDKYKYSQLDCQAFVEAVLKDIGVRKPDGKPYDWRGSNAMYRNYYSWRGSVEECIKAFGQIPPGAFVYMWKDSGEQERGYTDGLGNCTHVGIYCGQDRVRDSTRSTKTKRDGVGTRTLQGFNRVTLFSGLDYTVDNSYNEAVDNLYSILDGIRNKLIELEGCIDDIFRSKTTT